jgi:hypothetical protein
MTDPRFLQQPMLSEQEKDLLLARNDALSAFVVWVCLEGLSLLVLPNFRFLSGEHKLFSWFLISVPLGMVGAGLIGFSSVLVRRVQERVDRSYANKPALVVLSQAVGWLGLVGIGLPMAMVGLELLNYMQNGVPQ